MHGRQCIWFFFYHFNLKSIFSLNSIFKNGLKIVIVVTAIKRQVIKKERKPYNLSLDTTFASVCQRSDRSTIRYIEKNLLFF